MPQTAPQRGGAAFLFDLATQAQLERIEPEGVTGQVFVRAVSLQGHHAVLRETTLTQEAAYSFALDAAGANYCSALPNSTGSPAEISACGSDWLEAQLLSLRTFPVPNNTYLFFVGTTQTQLPFGNGLLCAGGSIVRLNSPLSASDNTATLNVDLSAAGIQTAGLYHFQCWYRDPAPGGSAYNLSDGLALELMP